MVCDLPEEQRGARLDAACGADADLRREVEALLSASSHALAFLRSPPVRGDARGPDEADSGVHGERRIGPYRLLEAIASGGMGTVYRAERADEQFRKEVAIKLIRRGLIDEQSRRRFRLERQALALLEHPNIARLLDGGVTNDGDLYIVMEFVRGQPIDVYCDAQRLGIAGRIRLFLRVCAAVQHAHRNLVIHRDLKPSNILVTDDGEPKLLDFGIAKLLQPESAAPAETLTLQLALTPAYASPEQIRGMPATTATDVYSLGMVLYELLTGHRPYRTEGRPLRDVERTVLETEPLPPSSAVWRVDELPADATGPTRWLTPQSVSATRESTPQRLSRRLRGDLDNIVLTALRKEPLRRYAAIGPFADDLAAYLEHRPVTARRDTVLYRARKFTRRHTVVVVASVFVLAAVLVAVVGITREARVAERQRDEALRATAQAQTVVAFLEDMITSVRPGASGQDVRVREVLDAAARRMEDDLEVEPEVKASLHGTIGRAYSALGMYAESEAHLRAALELSRTALGEQSLEVILRMDDLGDLLYGKGELDEAEALLRPALERARERLGNEHPTTTHIKTDLAEVLAEHRDLAEAERLFGEVLATRRKELGDTHLDVAESLNRLAGVAERRGDYDTAARHLAEALRIHRALLDSRSPMIIESVIGLARALHNNGDDEAAAPLLAEAVPYVRRALAMHRRMLGDDHVMTNVLMNELGELLAVQGELEGAEQLFREALSYCLARAADENQATPRVRHNTAMLQHNLAMVLKERGRLDEAETLLRAALETRETSLGPDDLTVGDTLMQLAIVTELRGESEQAAVMMHKALRILEQRLGPGHPLVIEAQAHLARLEPS